MTLPHVEESPPSPLEAAKATASAMSGRVERWTYHRGRNDIEPESHDRAEVWRRRADGSSFPTVYVGSQLRLVLNPGRGES